MDSTLSIRRLAVASLLTIASSSTAVLAQNSTTSAALQSCLSDAGVYNVISIDEEWANATTHFQKRLPASPAAVAYPDTEDEVALALGCARESAVKVSSLGGANSFQAFGFGEPGNLIINMAAFDSILYDECSKTVTYGGSVRVGPLMKTIWDADERHIPHVRGAIVGAVGSSIGGGYGSTSRHLGTPMDNVIGVRYMLYNGTVVEATEGDDLLWAAQGAGASFGVILSMTSKTHSPAHASAVSFSYSLGALSLDNAAEALLAVQDWALEPDSPDELALRWSLTSAQYTGTGYYYGDPATFDDAIAPLISRWEMITNTTVSLSKTELPFWDMEVAIAGAGMNHPTGGSPAGRASYTQSFATRASEPLTLDQARALISSVTLGFTRTDMSRTGFMDLWGGVSRDIDDADTAYAHGDNLWLIRVDGVSTAGDDGFPSDGLEYMQGLVQPFADSLEAAGSPLRSFVNYVDAELSLSEWSQRLYGANFARLQQIKAAVDPEGLFNGHRQTIPLP